MSKQKTITLIDADTLCFRAAAAAETRAVEVFHRPSGRSKIFKTRTAFKESLKEKNFEFKPEDYEYNDIQSEEDVSHPLHSMKVTVKRIMEISQADEYRLFVGGEGNFRLDLPLVHRYKSGRDGMLRPVHLSECKEFAIRSLGGELICNAEADDAIHYVGNRYLAKGYRVVLAVADKDAHSHSGMEIYNFTDSDLTAKDIWKVPDFGSLWIDAKGKVRGNGFMWFAFQWLYGDKVDGLIPYEIAGVKFGEKAAFKLLQSAQTKQEAVDIVMSQYRAWYKDCPEYTAWDGKSYVASPEFMAQVFFRGVRMMSTVDDKLDLQEFMKKEGLSYA